MPDTTSVSLLEGIQNRCDEEAWRRFAEIYEPLIENWLLRQGAEREDAEDLRQEVMSVVFQQIDGFTHNGRTGAFRNWLRTIAIHSLRAAQRKRTPIAQGGSDLLFFAQQLEDPHSQLCQMWDEEYNHHVLSRLLALIEDDFEKRTLLAFRRTVLQEQSPQTVAQELGVKVNVIHNARWRVLSRLRAIGKDLLD